MPDSAQIMQKHGPALLALGFRPFFLSAGLWAVASLLLWLGMLRGFVPVNTALAANLWHAHEMLFGYTMAAIAGFLLTAVRNWTGVATATGSALAGLALLWLAGRVLPWTPVPAPLTALVDAAFPLALAWSLRKPLWHGENRANRVFVLLLVLMGLATLPVHARAAGWPTLGIDGITLMLGLILLTLMVVAGRILPFFTRVAIAGSAPVSRPWVERLTFAAAAVWITAGALKGPPLLIAGSAVALAVLLALRLAGWYRREVWSIPMLAVLYAGALWLIAGLVLTAAGALGMISPFPALHALTVGTIGVFTLGMMVRVTLGHTGRPMETAPSMLAAFWLINLAAAVRVAGPLVWPAGYAHWMLLSGALWTLAFGLFVVVIGPMLTRPRVDGRPG